MATTVKITPASGLLEFYDTAQTSAAKLLSTDGSTIQLYATGSTSALTGPSFSSGFTGAGWRVDTGIATTSKSSFEADNLTIRGTMRVYELLINQIRASNGSLVISSTGKAATVSGGPTYTINTDANTNHGFATGDIVRAKRFTGSGTYDSWLSVASTPSTTQFTATVLGGSSVPVAGYEYVRLGSSTDTNRQGVIYMTADDSNAPFISILDGVSAYTAFNTFSTTKVLLGKLSGITSPTFGTLSGYGLYTQNAYLEGNVNIAGTLTAGDANGVGSTFYAGNVLTNLIPNSEAASLYFTSLHNITSITDNNVHAPNQTKTASKILVSNTSEFWIEKNMQSPLYVQSGQAYTVSVWLLANDTEIGKAVVVNFSFRATGGTTYGQGAKTVTLTNSWQRVSLTVTATADCENFDVWISNSGTGPSWFYVWGTMINIGSYAGTYQKTDATLATMLGSNKVINSTLDTTANYTNWYGDASISIVNAGKGQITGSTGGISTGLTGNALLKHRYLVRVKLKLISGATTVRLSNGTGNFLSWVIDSTERQYSGIAVANYGGAIYWCTAPSQTYEIDDVELYEIYDAYGMWSIAGGFGGTIQNPVVSASSAGLRVLDNSQTATAVTAAGTYIGKYSVSGYQAVLISSAGITGYTGSTTVTNFNLPTSGTASIAGWSFDANSLTSTNIGLHSVGYSEGAEILLGHATAYASAKVGLKADGSGKLASGYLTWDTTGNLTVGSTAAGDNNVYIAALGSLQFRNATTVLGQLDGATWTLGQDAESRIVITNTDLSLYDGAVTPIKRIYLDTTGLTIGKSDDNRITITDSAFSLYEGSAEKINIASTGVTVYGATAWDKAMLIAGGMEIYRNESSATIKTAIFGTTTVLGSDTAVTATSTDGCIRIDSTGIKLFENANDRVELLSTGMHIYESNTEVASFGATSTIGIVSGGEYVSIASTGIAMYGNAVQKVNIASDGTGWLGTSGSTGITWDASGNMTFGGSITNQGEPVSLTYSGSASYTNIADNDNLDFGTGDFSLELYLRPNSTSVGWIITKGAPETASACGWALYLNNGTLSVEFNDGGTVTSASLMTGLVVGTWYHVVAVFTRTGSITGYANAVVKSSLNISARTNSVNNTNPVYLGAYAAGSCWSGSIAYARLYNCAVSAAEIATLYNNGRPDQAEVPIRCKWGSQTELVTGDNSTFTSGIGSWTFWYGTASTKTLTATGGKGVFDIVGGSAKYYISALARNKYHRISFKAKSNSGTTTININGNDTTYISGSTAGAVTITGTEQTYVMTILSGNAANYPTISIGAETTANFEIDDFLITEIGCVAEYKAENSSLATWYDSSSNALNGTNTAVTLSNNSKIWSDGFYLSAVGTTPSRIAAASFTSTDIWAGATILASADTKFVLGDLGTATPKIALGATADSITGTSTSGIYLAGDGTFNFATDANNYIRKTSTNVEVASQDFELNSSNLGLSGNTTSSYIKIGTLINATNPAVTTFGFRADNAGNVLIKAGTVASKNYLLFDSAGSVSIVSDTFDLLTTGTNKVGVNGTRIALGATLPTAYNSGTGFFIDNTGAFLAGIHTGNRIQWSGSEVTIVATNAQITGTTGWLGASGVLSWSGSTVTAGGFTITTSAIYKLRTALGNATAGIYIGTDGIEIGGASATPFFKATSSSGIIAGFTFSSSYLTTGTKVAINTVSGTGVYVGTDGISLGTANGSGVSPFQVTSAGALTATSATITGTLSAGSGSSIGSWTVTTGLSTGRLSATDDSNAGVWIGGDGLSMGTTGASKTTLRNDGSGFFAVGKFSWDTSGAITSTATITGGTIQTAVSGYNIKLLASDNSLNFCSDATPVVSLYSHPTFNYFVWHNNIGLDFVQYVGITSAKTVHAGIFAINDTINIDDGGLKWNFLINTDGKLWWSGGAFTDTGDVNLYRSAANQLATDDLLKLAHNITNPTTTSYGITFGGTTALTSDVNLYRSAANILKTDGAFVASTFNELTLTKATTGFTIAGGTTSKTLTVNNTIALSGTDSTTITLPATTGTVALNNQTMYIGTTSVAINRASALITLTGISGVEGTAAGTTIGTVYASLKGYCTSVASAVGVIQVQADGTIAGGSVHATRISFFTSGPTTATEVERMRLDKDGMLTVVGNVVAYGSLSDARLKDSVYKYESVWTLFNKIDAVRFTYNDKFYTPGVQSFGFIAQEVERLIPELVYETKLLNGDTVYKALLYEKFTPILWKGMQEVTSEIDILKARVKELEEKLNGKN